MTATLRVAVTDLDKYASYMGDEDFPFAQLLRELRRQVPRTPAMERGHAFAKAMEALGLMTGGVTDSVLVSEGHAFAFTCDVEVENWPRRELKAEKDYGGIIVSARCDRIRGWTLADDKTTESFSKGGIERYLDKWQWRYYLDIFGAREFIWHIWECRKIDIGKHGGIDQYPGVYHAWEVFNHHAIRNYRYPALEEECRDFAQEYREFAERSGIYA